MEANAPADLFELPPGRSRKASPEEGRLRGRVAAAAEMLVRAGDERKRAWDLVATTLRKGEYRVPRGRKTGRGDPTITSTTVQNWCKEAGEGGRGSVARQTFERLIADADREARQERHAGREREFWGYAARLTLAELVSGNPEGPTYQIALEPVSPPKK